MWLAARRCSDYPRPLAFHAERDGLQTGAEGEAIVREYARLVSGFWRGHTGRLIRKLGPNARVVAVYLISGPEANMIGLYSLPIPILCHDTGLSEKEASKALQGLFEADFAAHDSVSDDVWVFNMAIYQIADQLNPNDKQCKGVWRELLKYKNSKFFKGFYDRYRTKFHLPPLDFPVSSKSPFEGPAMALRSQDQDQDQDQEKEQEQELDGHVKMLAVPPKSERTWQAYAGEYSRRYGVQPVRNAKTNSQLCQLVDRLGREEAPQVAAFYLSHAKPIYTSNRHPVSLLLRDAEGIRTDLLTKLSGIPDQTTPKTMAEWCVLHGARNEA
jgi:hypothetical protein